MDPYAEWLEDNAAWFSRGDQFAGYARGDGPRQWAEEDAARDGADMAAYLASLEETK